MTLHPHARKSLIAGTLLLGIAVLIGAFGAHGLKNLVEEAKLVTFETGVRYHFYHGFALILLGLCQQLIPSLKSTVAYHSFLVGILLFSFNCYFYALTSEKTFAMVVPMGGVLFMVGWFAWTWQLLKKA